MNELRDTLNESKLKMIEVHLKNNVGLIGGNLSCIDILVVLFHRILNVNDDSFILSKGHSALAYYVVLYSLKLITNEDLNSFSKENTNFAGHPSGKKIPGLLFPTGSLGHGPSLAAGFAYGNQLKNNDKKIFCLCSDGEWQEGSCWEALIFASHHKLNNLTLIIDQNKFQGYGSTNDTVGYDSLLSRITSFNVDAFEINGHDLEEIEKFLLLKTKNVKVLICNTVKGNGLRFANTISSHYEKISLDEYEKFKDSLI